MKPSYHKQFLKSMFLLHFIALSLTLLSFWLCFIGFYSTWHGIWAFKTCHMAFGILHCCCL